MARTIIRGGHVDWFKPVASTGKCFRDPNHVTYALKGPIVEEILIFALLLTGVLFGFICFIVFYNQKFWWRMIPSDYLWYDHFLCPRTRHLHKVKPFICSFLLISLIFPLELLFIQKLCLSSLIISMIYTSTKNPDCMIQPCKFPGYSLWLDMVMHYGWYWNDLN